MATESDPRHKEALQDTLESMEQMEITEVWEFWIGEDDYLVWQQQISISQKIEETTMTMTMITKFSNFNETVEIEPPL